MELESLSTIFQKKLFRIPAYQRGYAWQEAQLIDFWEDLGNLRDGSCHYTGMLSLKRRLDGGARSDCAVYDIVDGQQRLTTSVILIHELLSLMKESGDSGNPGCVLLGGEKLSAVREKYICRVTPGDGAKTYILDYGKENQTSLYMQNVILGTEKEDGNEDEFPETCCTRSLAVAKEFFQANLLAKKTNEGLAGITALYHTLTRQMLFCVREIEDDNEVFVASETMNNRGRTLSKLDLLKSRLLYLTMLYAEDDLPEREKAVLRGEINSAWSEVYAQLGKKAYNPISDDEYLRAHWISFFPYEEDSAGDYMDFLLSKFAVKNILRKKTCESVFYSAEKNPGQFLAPQEMAEYVRSLKNLAKDWYATFDPYESEQLSESEKSWIVRLNRLGTGYFRPLLMVAAHCGASEADRLALFKAIERFSFMLFRLGGADSSAYRNEFYRYTGKLYRGTVTVREITARLEVLTAENREWAVSSFCRKSRDRLGAEDGGLDSAECALEIMSQELPVKPDENNRAEVMKNMSKEEPMESEGSECSGIGIELLMYHAMNAVKVCCLQYNLLNCKDYEEAVKYKAALDAFTEVVKDIYDYENYGFFSTTVHVKESGLPCNIRCGCDREWILEPYLDGQQKPRFAKVIRFENRRGKEPGYDRKNDLCMTISDTPEILEGRDKCVLTDDEIQQIKDFVITNREAILAHARGDTGSCEFLEACRKHASPL